MADHDTQAGGGPDAGGPELKDDLDSPIEAAKRLALAGLGAVAAATEATDEVFQTLVKKGEEARDQAVREIREARQRNADKRADSLTFLGARLDAFLRTVNLASRGDIEALNAKLNIITRKLDEMGAGRAASPPPDPSASQPREQSGDSGPY